MWLLLIHKYTTWLDMHFHEHEINKKVQKLSVPEIQTLTVLWFHSWFDVVTLVPLDHVWNQGGAPIRIECTSTSANVSLFLAWLQPGVQHVYVWGCRGPTMSCSWLEICSSGLQDFFNLQKEEKNNKMADFVLSWISSLCCLRPEATLKNIPFKVSFSHFYFHTKPDTL